MTQAGAALLARMRAEGLRLVQFSYRGHQYTLLRNSQRYLGAVENPIVLDLLRAGAITELGRSENYGTKYEECTISWGPTVEEGT